jgi:peptidoglycan/LPS O-acetylase OafA/YrhL
MRYRPDIDGLRALAVLPVVLFHAGFSWFGGGYIGVDVFFVISGFLITSLIAEEIREERFSLISFYERRIRRIFPALFAVILFSCIAALGLYFPLQFVDFTKSILATTIFASNMYFWRSSGYFEGPTHEFPLLHTWSLSVEEQFYIVFPLLLIIIHRWSKQRWIMWLALIAIVSFALSVWGITNKPRATFYIAPTRAWELLLGSLLALRAFPQIQDRLTRELSSIAGLGLIAWSIFAFTADTPFPGINALFPCVGAALLIHSGESGPTAARDFLCTKPLVFIGLISYSLYLWHWPLLVFAESWKIDKLTEFDKIAVIGLSFLAAVLSWKFVEMPFRKRGGFITKKILFSTAACTMAFAVVFGVLALSFNGWPGRFPALANEIASYTLSKNARTPDCLGGLERKNWIPVTNACHYGANVAARYAVWGDSHADGMVNAIGKVAERHNEAALFFGLIACPPILGINRMNSDYARDGNCAKYNDQVAQFLIGNDKIDTVILVARYALYIEGGTVDFGPVQDRANAYLITNEDASVNDLPGRKALFRIQLTETINRLVKAGKRTVLVYPVPETGYNIPTALARLVVTGKDPNEFTRPKDFFLRRQQFVFDVLDGLGNSSQIIRIHPHRALCDDKNCIVYSDGKPLYHDENHLSLAGVERIAPLFESLFMRTGSKPAKSQSEISITY